MGSNYVSEPEQRYRDERRARAIEIDAESKRKNTRLVGEPKHHRGVDYQLRQDGMYVCLNLPKNSPIGELFNSERILKKYVDDFGPHAK